MLSFGTFYVHLVHFVDNLCPFWYVVVRIIWQSWLATFCSSLPIVVDWEKKSTIKNDLAPKTVGRQTLSKKPFGKSLPRKRSG
jgi:hypothetical protein